MPFVASDGNIVQKRPFGVALIMDYFWGVVNFANFFFRSLFHLDDPVTSRGQYGNAQRIPGRRMGGIRHGGGAAAPPCIGSS